MSTESFKSIRSGWKSVIQITVKVTYGDILFGIANPNEDIMISILNLRIMYATWYIHICKQDHFQPILTNYIKLVKDTL